MTPQQDNYARSLFVATQYAAQSGMTTQEICDPLIDQIAIRMAGVAKNAPHIDLDGLLELVRHKLDQQTAAYIHNETSGRILLPPVQPKPQPPKEPA